MPHEFNKTWICDSVALLYDLLLNIDSVITYGESKLEFMRYFGNENDVLKSGWALKCRDHIIIPGSFYQEIRSFYELCFVTHMILHTLFNLYPQSYSHLVICMALNGFF